MRYSRSMKNGLLMRFFARHQAHALDMGRSNENDVTYPLPVLGVRSTLFASAGGKVYPFCRCLE